MSPTRPPASNIRVLRMECSCVIVISHELLAIHTSNAPQFYPEASSCSTPFSLIASNWFVLGWQCAQLKITTGGSAVGTPTVKFPGGYSATDPSIDINVGSSSSGSRSEILMELCLMPARSTLPLLQALLLMRSLGRPSSQDKCYQLWSLPPRLSISWSCL